jgi:hypothetical protein
MLDDGKLRQAFEKNLQMVEDPDAYGQRLNFWMGWLVVTMFISHYPPTTMPWVVHL